MQAGEAVDDLSIMCDHKGSYEALTVTSMAVFRYCFTHSRSKMCLHFAWIASSATSLQIRHTAASPTSSSDTNVPALFLLRMTRSG